MILIIANAEIMSNYKDYLSSLSKKEFNKLFPKLGVYQIYLLIRDYNNTPIITDAADCTPNILDGGTIVEYVVE